MGDPGDFTLGRGRADIPKELWGSLQAMTGQMEAMLNKFGGNLGIAELKARERDLAKAVRILTKYSHRVRENRAGANPPIKTP